MDKTYLLNALKLARPALGIKSPIIGLNCYHWQSNQITAFNGTLSVKTNIVYDVEDYDLKMNGWLEGSSFFRLVSELPDKFDLSIKDDDLIIKAGRTRVKLPITQLEHPLWVEPSSELSDDAISIPVSDELISGIRHCIISLGKSNENAGIGLLIKDNECTMYSSDSTIYSRFKFNLESTIEVAIILPAMFCEELQFLCDKIGTPPQSIIVEKDHIRAVFPNVIVYCMFGVAEFKPHYEAFFNQYEEEIKYINVPEGFNESLKRCEVIANPPNVTISFGNEIVLSTGGIGAITEDLGEYNMDAEDIQEITVPIKSLKSVLDMELSQIGFSTECVAFMDDNSMYLIAGKV
jgi:DNA polymerase III sliding clamp (beta) subunit (PCNA family)